MNFLNKDGLILLWSHIQEFVNSAVSSKADKDYVDEQIAAIPTPDVSGQINEHNTDEEAHADIRAAIAALEGSGGTGGGSVQPDWEQNDEAALDYIKNRPFYDTRSVVDTTITFDGNMDGKEAVNMGDPFYLVKVSDKIINSSEMIGGTMSIFSEGNIESYEIEDYMIFSQYPLDVIDECIFICHEETAMNDTTTLTPGIWFMCINVDGISGVYVSSMSNQLVEGELKTIDPKYITTPDWNKNDANEAGYIKNRTHWSDYEMQVKTIVDNLMADFGSYTFIADPFDITIIENEIYTVIWDGVEYRCTAYVDPYYNNLCIGNGSLFDSNGGNEEPFLIHKAADGYVELLRASGSERTHTISIIGLGKVEIVQHLDSKYIKDMYYEKISEKIVLDSFNNNFETATSTYYVYDLDINLNEGKTYKVIFDDVECSCVAYKYTDYYNNEYICLGNSNIKGIESINSNNEPFLVRRESFTSLSINVNIAGEHTISIYEVNNELQKIDPKYIQDMYYEEQPKAEIFYENSEIDFTNANPIYDLGIPMLTVGASYVVTWDGETYNCIARDDGYNEIYIGNQSCSPGWGFPETIESNEPFFIATWDNGNSNMISVESLEIHSISISAIGEPIIHKIDPKYLPDDIGGGVSSWNDLTDKPFGEEAQIFAQDVTLSDASLIGYFGLTLGDTYIVTYDGHEYKLVCFDDNGCNTIGAPYDNYEDYPFCIWMDNDGTNKVQINCGDTDTHIVSMKGILTKTIDQKYLPKSLQFGEETQIVVEETGAYNVTVLEYFDLTLGETYVVTYDGNKYELVCFDDGGSNTIGAPYGNYEEYPFTIWMDIYNNNQIKIKCSDWNDHVVSVAHTSIKTIDPKYLPDDIGGCIKTQKTDDMTQLVGVDENGLVYASKIFDGIILKDAVNGYEYIAEMQNGNFVTYCRCDHIEITELPTKTEYEDGDVFDPSGMVITSVSQDGSTRVIENYTYSGEINESVDSIEIQYIEAGVVHSAIVDIVVSVFDTSMLIDFEYIDNGDGTYTLTEWKKTLNGVPSTVLQVPNSSKIIL